MGREGYHIHCDPRLNAGQALDIAFYVAYRLRRCCLPRLNERLQLQVRPSCVNEGARPFPCVPCTRAAAQAAKAKLITEAVGLSLFYSQRYLSAFLYTGAAAQAAKAK